MGLTVVVWAGLCVALYMTLVADARGAPLGAIDEYARTSEHHELNFVVGYLPELLGILAAVLAVEELVFWLLRRSAGGVAA